MTIVSNGDVRTMLATFEDKAKNTLRWLPEGIGNHLTSFLAFSLPSVHSFVESVSNSIVATKLGPQTVRS